MVNVDDAVIARYSKGDLHFEVLVDPKAVQMVKDGKNVVLSDILASDIIFKNARKGEKAAEENVVKVFGSLPYEEIVLKIIREGEVQLTTEQRRTLMEEKKRQIIEYISINSVDPHTGAPHPPQRIEKALSELKVKIDPFKKIDSQIEEILKELRVLLPLKFDKVKIQLKVKGEFYGKVINEIKSSGKILKDEWLNDGSWSALVEIPGGMQNTFIQKINDKLHGACEIKVVK
ncbi:MAG: ribosome assembly factor SBDS [Thermoplasmata archaeon]